MLSLKLWQPDGKNWLTGKDPDSGKDWRQEKGMTEDEMVGRHPWLYWHEFEQALGVGDGQKSLECSSPWSLKGSGTIERLNWTKLKKLTSFFFFLNTFTTSVAFMLKCFSEEKIYNFPFYTSIFILL